MANDPHVNLQAPNFMYLNSIKARGWWKHEGFESYTCVLLANRVDFGALFFFVSYIL